MLDRRMENQGLLKAMTYIGGGVTVAVILMRIWLVPTAADWQTGLFPPNYWVIGLMLAALIALGVMSRMAGSVRRELTGRGAVFTAIAALIMGLTMVITGGIDLLTYDGVLGDGYALINAASPILPLLEHLFCLLGGAAMIRFGFALLSEGATRRGIAQWSILAPVMWMWMRLINYEMSYASMIRIEDNFFGLVMFIVEMLFLFRFARYVSGIGGVSAASMLFHTMATAIFALSGPLVRVGMYLLQDSEAYAAYHLAGPIDVAVGVFAFVVGVALLSGAPALQSAPVVEEEVSSDAEDVSATAGAEELLFGVPEDLSEEE